MQGKSDNLLKFFFLALIILSITPHSSASLSTNSRWIVSPSGDRVKFRCVNWAGHLHAMIPEGLNKQPIKTIAQKVKLLGFNCVRLTWAVQMYTLPQNKNLTVEKSLNAWNLTGARDGIQKNNPGILKMTIADAQKSVIDALGANNVMVILDNHVSFPMWCCANDDGNGFFGDKYFWQKEWLEALGIVANRYKGNPAVVGMSMRNELRGPRQNVNAWYHYMQEGAEAIHKQNPDLLVIVSGLNFDTNLNFLKQRPFKISFKNKIVFESHIYAFGDPFDQWKYQTNNFCEKKTQWFFDQSGFLINGHSNSSTFPLFISEFGVDLSVDKEMENYYLTCVLAFMAENDFDWALWTLQGSYMLRQGKQDSEEEYGILSKDWGNVRNSNIRKKLQLIQQINLDAKSHQPTYLKMFHPQTGLCVQVNKNNMYATGCQSWASWSHKGDGAPIKLSDGRCLVAVADGQPPTLSTDCSSSRATWNLVSASKLHIASKNEQGNWLCLQLENTKIVTRKCLCVNQHNYDLSHCNDNPTSQWFKLVPFNIKS